MSVYTTSPRNRIRGRVEFHEIDPTAAKDCTASINSVDSHSDMNIYSPVAAVKCATLETDRWILDGSWPLYDPSIIGKKYGWWSSDLSTGDGTFTSPIVMTFTFSTLHTCRMLTLYWDCICNTYPIDYTVDFYNGATLLGSQTLIATSSISAVEVNQFNFNKIVITIRKWSKAYERARTECIIFGLVTTYDDNRIVSFTINNKLDESNGLLEPATLDVQILNLDKSYNPISATSADKFYQKNQYMLPFMAVQNLDGTAAYQSLGIYYLDSWDTSTSIASFKSLGITYQLEKEFPKTLYTNATLRTILLDVFTLCGIQSYIIPDAAASKTVTVLLDGPTCREIVQYIAIVLGCSVFVDQDNNIVIGNPRKITSEVITKSISSEPSAVVLPTYRVMTISRYAYNSTTTKMDETVETITIGTDGSTLQYSGNVFIQSVADANAVSSYLNGIRAQQRVEFKIDWIEDPEIVPGNQIGFYTKYSNSPLQGVVAEQEYKFDGGLRGTTVVRTPMQS